MPFSQSKRHFIEQRQSPRHRVEQAAWIDADDGSQVRDCTLWDVSEAGARIVIGSPAEVPQEFSLVFSSDGSIRRRCQVIWRSDQQIGARYLTAPDWNWTA